MTRRTITDILNDLLEAEQSSLIERVWESTVFLGPDSADAEPVVRRMTDEVTEHRAWLADLIQALGGSLRPRAGSVTTADLHFQALRHVLPRVVSNEADIVARYEASLPDLSRDPRAAALASKILTRHRRHVDQLTALTADHAGA